MTEKLWVKLDDVKLWDRNPNIGNVPALAAGIENFGFRQPIALSKDNLTKTGNHRVKALKMLRDSGWEAWGSCIRVDANGDWLIEYIDHSDLNESVGDAYATSDNRIARLGSDDAEKLAKILSNAYDDDNVNFDAIGFDEKALDELNKKLRGEHGLYTADVETPIYTPSDSKPDVKELFDETKTLALIADIHEEDLSVDEMMFLTYAAYRHVVMNFSKIADYYAHSRKEVQKLMEDSALVIIDFNRAIELGYVEAVNEIQKQEEIDSYDED